MRFYMFLWEKMVRCAGVWIRWCQTLSEMGLTNMGGGWRDETSRGWVSMKTGFRTHRLASLALSGEHFKFVPGTVSGPGTVGCSARLKTSFELNPVTAGKQGTFPFLRYRVYWITWVSDSCTTPRNASGGLHPGLPRRLSQNQTLKTMK